MLVQIGHLNYLRFLMRNDLKDYYYYQNSNKIFNNNNYNEIIYENQR